MWHFRKSSLLILLLVVSYTLLVSADNTIPQRYTQPTGCEDIQSSIHYPPYAKPDGYQAVDLVGDTVVIGTTWYDSQHNGTCGRMIEKSDDGYLHFVWMNGLNSGASDRHVYYNFIDPAGNQGWPGTGYQADWNSERGGYSVLDVDFGGIAFPAFHEIRSTNINSRSAAAADFFPHSGAFQVTQTPALFQGIPDLEVIWPQMQIDRNQVFHMVATENTSSAFDADRMYYIMGTYDPANFVVDFDDRWTLIDSTATPALNVAASDVSDRIAIAWSRPRDLPEPLQRNNDIYFLVDDDGIDPDFSQAVNLTNFIPPDSSYLPNLTLADMDTLRAYVDVDLFFDQDDWLHVTFTTLFYYGISGLVYWHPSIIWHWSEQFPDDFQMVHNAFDDYNIQIDCGSWNLKAQRPCLGQDPATGYLYCMYQVYDTETGVSANGWPSGEIYVSVSTDGGQNWAIGTNITETITPPQAPPGQCFSELTPSMAKLVDGECHIMYVLDRDAGFVIQGEGIWTLGDVIYHRVPVDLINTSPLVPQNVPFHVEHGSYTPDVSIDLVPFTTPVTIPATGGEFEFYLYLQNNTSAAQESDVWIDVTLPDGTVIEPLLGPATLDVEPGTTGWHRLQGVPANAPAGQYEYTACVGLYPGTVWSTDTIPFEKLGTSDNLEMTGWYSDGDGFDEEPVASPGNLPDRCTLHEARPNPFNPTTVLSYKLQVASNVNLAVYDVHGRKVAGLVNGWRGAGVHEVMFDGSELSSGIYFYRITAGDYSGVGKMVLMK